MERKGAAPSLWQRQTLSTKGESDGLFSSKIIISYSFELTRSGSANAPPMMCSLPNLPSSHDSTNALIFKRETTVDNRYKIMSGDTRMFELYMPIVLRSGSCD